MSALDQPSQTGLAPLFRWPGGKRWLVPKLVDLVPPHYGTYFEPFFGAGALFFALKPSAAVVSDLNSDLMVSYRMIRDDPDEVALHFDRLPRDRESYYQVRASRPTSQVARAARLIYLSTLAFNGIYRVNLRGEFNVPYGGREYPGLAAQGWLRPYADALRGAQIENCDFEAAVERAVSGDLVYLDPPYTVAHSNNGFLRYNERIFSWTDQQRLATLATELARRGCVVIVSNAAHESVCGLYRTLRAVSIRNLSSGVRHPVHGITDSMASPWAG